MRCWKLVSLVPNQAVTVWLSIALFIATVVPRTSARTLAPRNRQIENCWISPYARQFNAEHAYMQRSSLKDVVVRDPSPEVQVFDSISDVLQHFRSDRKKSATFCVPRRQNKQCWHHYAIVEIKRVWKSWTVSRIENFDSVSSRGAPAVDKNRAEFPRDYPLPIRLVSNGIGPQILRICHEGSLCGSEGVSGYIGALLCRSRTVLYRPALSFHLNQSILERFVIRVQGVLSYLGRTFGSFGSSFGRIALEKGYSTADNRTHSEHRRENDHSSLQVRHPFLDRNIALLVIFVALSGFCLLTLYVIYASAYKYGFGLKSGSFIAVGIVGGQVAMYFILKLLLG